MDRKAILWPVVVSILLHVTLLAVAGMINLNETMIPVDVLSVSIKEPELKEEPAPKHENKIKKKIKPVQVKKEKGFPIDDKGWREETINLSSADIKYVSYLMKIKQKILGIWQYPQKAFAKNEEGNVVIRMSIDADGSLAGATLLSSSGSVDLDDGALAVVQQAAPYNPLPGNYNLSRLHIIASFNYKIMD
jgi:protein TonB